jgi:FtsZ-interacting cell division protein ZipA
MATPPHRIEAPAWLTIAGEAWMPSLRPTLMLVVGAIIVALVRDYLSDRRRERERETRDAARRQAIEAANAASLAALDEAVAAVEARRQRAPKVRQRPTREQRRKGGG